MHQSNVLNLAIFLVVIMGGVLGLGSPRAGAATEEEIAKYRKIWNPFSAGPQLVSSADVQPKGQFFVRPYVYSEFTYGQFGNTWSAASRSLSRQLSAINPQVEFSYGITNSLEFEMYVSEASWWQSSGSGQVAQSGHGLGDTTAFLKYRFNVQQDDSWWPTLTNAFYVTLPTSDWAGTSPFPAGLRHWAAFRRRILERRSSPSPCFFGKIFAHFASPAAFLLLRPTQFRSKRYTLFR